MKIKSLAKGLLALSLLGALAGTASAQDTWYFPTQNFDFATGPLVGQGDWTWRGANGDATPTFDVVAGALVYPSTGIPASSGNSVRILAQTGQDVRLPFNAFAAPFVAGPISAADNNTYYWSALVEWDGTNRGTQSSYFGGFLGTAAAGSTTFRGILRTIGDDVNDRVLLGAQLYSGGSNDTVYAPIAIPANTPVFVVVKLTEVPGTRNDTTEIFVFVNTPVPATEPPTADAVSIYQVGPTTSGDVATTSGIQQFSLRQFQNLDWPGNWRVDMVRAGNTWTTAITDPPSNVSDWTTY